MSSSSCVIVCFIVCSVGLSTAHQLHKPFLGVHSIQLVYFPMENDTFSYCDPQFRGYARFAIRERGGDRLLFFFPLNYRAKACQRKIYSTSFYVRYELEDEQWSGLEPVNQVYYCDSMLDAPDWIVPVLRRIFLGNSRDEFVDLKPASPMDLMRLGVLPPLSNVTLGKKV